VDKPQPKTRFRSTCVTVVACPRTTVHHNVTILSHTSSKLGYIEVLFSRSTTIGLLPIPPANFGPFPYIYSVALPSAISQEIEIFSAFQPPSHNSSSPAFVTLINYFPNVSYLDIRCLSHVVEGKPPIPLSPPLLGQLRISGVYDFGSGFLDQLSELGPAFDEIIFDEPRFVFLPIFERTFNTVGLSVERLGLLDRLEHCTYITLQAEPTVKQTKSNTMFLQTVREAAQKTLSLQGAPGVRYDCEVSRGRSSRSRFLHRLHRHSKGNLRARSLVLRSPGS